MKKIAVILAPGFEEVEAVTVIDFLRRAQVPVVVVGVEDKMVTGSHNLSVKADARLGDLKAKDLDGVILPGGMPGSKNLASSAVLRSLVKELDENEKLIGAICAAPAVVLGPWGLLEGRSATCFPGFEVSFSHEVRFTSERVAVDGHLITSRGAGTAAEFSMSLIEWLVDAETAENIRESTLQPV